MQEKLAAIERQSALVQRRLDIISGMVWYASTLQDAALRQKAQQLLQIEGKELTRESDRLTAMLEQLRESKEDKENKMYRIPIITLLIVIVLSILLFGSVSAQGDLLTNTPGVEETEAITLATVIAPAPDVTVEAPIEPDISDGIETGVVTVLPTGFLVISVIALSGLGVGGLILVYIVVKSAEKNYPPVVVTEIRGIVADTFDKGFQAAKETAAKTASPWDDLLLSIGEPGVRRLISLLNAGEFPPPPPPIPSTPGNSDSSGFLPTAGDPGDFR